MMSECPFAVNDFGRVGNPLGMAHARNGSKPARSKPKEQPYPGRAEFFAPPDRGG